MCQVASQLTPLQDLFPFKLVCSYSLEVSSHWHTLYSRSNSLCSCSNSITSRSPNFFQIITKNRWFPLRCCLERLLTQRKRGEGEPTGPLQDLFPFKLVCSYSQAVSSHWHTLYSCSNSLCSCSHSISSLSPNFFQVITTNRLFPLRCCLERLLTRKSSVSFNSE